VVVMVIYWDEPKWDVRIGSWGGAIAFNDDYDDHHMMIIIIKSDHHHIIIIIVVVVIITTTTTIIIIINHSHHHHHHYYPLIRHYQVSERSHQITSTKRSSMVYWKEPSTSSLTA